MAPAVEHLLIVHIAGAVGGAERTTNNLLLGLGEGFVGKVSLLAMPAHREYWVERYDDYLDAAQLGIRGWFEGPGALRHDVTALAALIRRHRPTLILGVMHYGTVVAVNPDIRPGVLVHFEVDGKKYWPFPDRIA